MALTEEEMKARWKAGIQDINDDGGVNLFDIMAAARFTREEGEGLVSTEELTESVMSGETQQMDLTAMQKQTQRSDIQANPLPSLPSISNVGSVPFTGTVSNIPGGFQPLPQVAGGRKKLYQLSKFHGGINQKSSPRDIADFECQEATNVTVSQIGRIKLLGDIKDSTESITFTTIDVTDRGSAGYGLFQFTAPASVDATVGEFVITLTNDGSRIDADDSEGPTSAFMSLYSGSGSDTNDHDTAVVYYAAGNGVYACDANFSTSHHTNIRKARVYVYREDAGSNTVSGWVEGNPLINSPSYDDDNTEGNMVAGSIKCQSDAAAPTAAANGAFIASCDPTGTGSWDGDYFFYVSWLFDGGVETGLTSFANDSGTTDQVSDGITFDNETLSFNLSILHANGTPLGDDKRVEGARIYFKESGTAERWLLAEFNMIDGVKGALDSTFTPWTEGSDVYTLASDIIFDAPPSVYSYSSLNGYYANEVYGDSADSHGGSGGAHAGPTPHDLRYKTAVVGSGGIVFIGNVKFKGKHMPDSMMFSMPGKPGVFPQYNRFDSPSSDGSPITALAAHADTILQFKENAMYVINVSNPNQFYAQASFRDCGVFNPCQVFTTSFGVIFANINGCYIYDGQKVTSLTDGKFGIVEWDLPSDEGSSIGGDGLGVPCVGYDPRSQTIIVLKDINDDATDTGAWVYNMVTQSWTEGADMITNANGNRHTNFIITSGGYLSILRDDSTSLFNYKQGEADSNVQKILYNTKDLDMGLPSTTKKLFKVYVTYKGNATNVGVYYYVNGDTSATAYDFTETNWGNDAGTTDYEVATLVPDTASQGKDWNSIIISFDSSSNTVAEDFEINDISILYRVRPIK